MRLFSRWCEAAVNSFGTPALFSRWRHALAAWLVVVWLSLNASAEIIIDDFDDPAHVVLPEMENVTVTTMGVGALRVERRMNVTSFRTDPIGTLDVNMARQSHLTARIVGQVPDTAQSVPLLAFGAGYYFSDPMDLRENGNDAVFFDVSIFQGVGIPAELSVELLDDDDTFLAIVSRFSLLSDSPNTLTIPFSSFGSRGGGGGSPDFSKVTLLGFTARLLTGSRDPETNWLVQIDRIRVGRMVPEPNCAALSLATVITFGFVGSSRHRFANHSITRRKYHARPYVLLLNSGLRRSDLGLGNHGNARHGAGERNDDGQRPPRSWLTDDAQRRELCNRSRDGRYNN